MKKKSKRVGLLLLTKKDDNTTVAHLEKRDVEKDSPHRTWPGVHLVTIGGKVGKDDNELITLYRQLNHKFGPYMSMLIATILLEHGPRNNILFKNDRVTLYGLVIPQQLMQEIHPEKVTNGFTAVTKSDLSMLIKAKREWKHQPHGTDGIVVFPETEKALARAFKKL